jgi:hypothetical protein
MTGLGGFGRTLLLLGAVLVVLGVVFLLADRFPGSRIGRLPGDISVERGNFRFYFPLATSIIASIVLSLLFWVFGRRG